MNQTANNLHLRQQVVIVGGGPAGLMAAEVISRAGFSVAIYDAMPSLGRKFLLAGVGGMNITHGEAYDQFVTRYGQAASILKSYLDKFSPSRLREWIHGLGIETFVGSSQRVFPSDMKAAPLLRAWLHRLRELNVQFYPRHQWLGWGGDGSLRIVHNANGIACEKLIHADAVVFALGGASWQRLGSNGAWVPLLRDKDIQIAELLPSNCGFNVLWSERLQQEFSGVPLQTISLSLVTLAGEKISLRGEAMLVKSGIEGTSIYALSAHLRDLILAEGAAQLNIDLLPDLTLSHISAQLSRPRGKNSLSNFLRKQLNLSAVKLALLRELTSVETWQDFNALASSIKSLPLRVTGFRSIDEAISTAGGIQFNNLDARLMLHRLPGYFCAGEMLDWEAPTGGYLLTACLATGYAAGEGVVDFLQNKKDKKHEK